VALTKLRYLLRCSRTTPFSASKVLQYLGPCTSQRARESSSFLRVPRGLADTASTTICAAAPAPEFHPILPKVSNLHEPPVDQLLHFEPLNLGRCWQPRKHWTIQDRSVDAVLASKTHYTGRRLRTCRTNNTGRK
jgi:hypothetical protein